MNSTNAAVHTLTKISLAASLLLLGCLENVAIADSKLAETLESIRAKHKLPALAAAVLVDGKLVDYAAVGVRKVGSDVEVTRDDKFHIGSCTKAMTATLIGILVDQGKLQWNSTVAEVLPELADEIHADFRSVAVDHLLMHRAGLPPADETYKGVDVAALPKDPRGQRLAYIRQLMSKPPQFKPGSQKTYSNAGYSVLGVMAETVLDKPWETLMTELVFTQLKMDSAGFGAMGTATRMDQPWQHRFENGKHVPVPPSPRADNLDAIGPGGKVHCSMADWSKFIAVHLANGATTPLLRPETLRHLQTPRFGGDYAGGWVVVSRSWAQGTALYHNGSNTMNYCTTWLSPKRKFAVLQATNCAAPAARKACDEVAGTLINEYLGPASPADGPRPKEDKQIAQLAMRWFSLVQNQQIPPRQLNQGLRQFFGSPNGREFCATLKQLGEPAAFEFHSSRNEGATTVYVYKLKFASGDWRWEVGFGGNSIVNWILARSPF